jgi:hypothetical protein
MIRQLEFESKSKVLNSSIPVLHAKHRPEVKEKIFKAYELHDGAHKLQALLDLDEGVKNNSLLVAQFQTSSNSMRTERDAILAIPEALLHSWERNFRTVVKNKMDTGGVVFNRTDHPRMTSWVLNQRNRSKKIDTLKRRGDVPMLLEDRALLQRIGLDMDFQPPPTKSFDDRFQQLVAYKEKHGNLKIPRLIPGSNLGEWVAKIRQEHDRVVLDGKQSINLTPPRIQAMSDLGFIWKVRFGRPKKGDPKFRLRRKSQGEGEEGTAAAPAPAAAAAATLEETNREDPHDDGTATTTSAGS